MASFLVELCEDNFNLFNLFLFDAQLLADIRLWLINELILRRFHLKLISINHINDLFGQVHVKEKIIMTLFSIKSVLCLF